MNIYKMVAKIGIEHFRVKEWVLVNNNDKFR